MLSRPPIHWSIWYNCLNLLDIYVQWHCFKIIQYWTKIKETKLYRDLRNRKNNWWTSSIYLNKKCYSPPVRFGSNKRRLSYKDSEALRKDLKTSITRSMSRSPQWRYQASLLSKWWSCLYFMVFVFRFLCSLIKPGCVLFYRNEVLLDHDSNFELFLMDSNSYMMSLRIRCLI